MLAGAPLPATGQSRAADTVLVNMDLREATLAQVAAVVAEATGRNLVFVPDAFMDRRVTIVAPRPLPVDALMELLRAALSLHGLTLERRSFGWIIQPVH
jgi:type II secretory pathway component GspD/PulD (secretin)